MKTDNMKTIEERIEQLEQDVKSGKKYKKFAIVMSLIAFLFGGILIYPTIISAPTFGSTDVDLDGLPLYVDKTNLANSKLYDDGTDMAWQGDTDDILKYDISANAWIFQVAGTDELTIDATDIDAHTKKIVNVVDPTADQDASTKKYHDDHSTMKTQYKMRAYLSADQTGIPSGASTLIELDTINYDPSGMFNTSTHLATIPVTGYYHIVTRIGLKNPGSGTRVGATISKVVDSTYTTLSYAVYYATGTKNIYVGLSDILYLEAGDTVCMKCYQDSGSSKDTDHGSHICFMAIHFLSE